MARKIPWFRKVYFVSFFIVKRGLFIEAKNKKFIRLDYNRFSRVIERIQHLWTLSANNKYYWTGQGISDIFIALE